MVHFKKMQCMADTKKLTLFFTICLRADQFYSKLTIQNYKEHVLIFSILITWLLPHKCKFEGYLLKPTLTRD